MGSSKDDAKNNRERLDSGRGPGLEVNARIAAMARRAGDLQAMPAVLTRALQCIDSSTSSSAELASILNTDPTIAGRLTGIANSALYVGSRRFVTVHEAIVRIGYRNVRELLLATAVVGMAKAPLRLYGMGPGELWKHCLATAAAARLLGLDSRIATPERCYMAGLLHDLGRVMFDRALPPTEASALVNLVRSKNAVYQDAETALFGFCHAELGAFQLLQWGVDPETVGAVAAHHSAQPATMAAIIHTADVLAIIANSSVASPGWGYSVSPKILASLGPRLLPGRDWQQRIDRTVGEIQQGVGETDKLLSGGGASVEPPVPARQSFGR